MKAGFGSRRKEKVKMKVKKESIKIELNTPLKEVLGEDFILTGIRPYYEYVNGAKTDKQLGFSYEVVLLGHAYEKVSVKIPGVAHIPEEKIKDGIPVLLEGLAHSVYTSVNNGFVNYNLSLSATGIKVKGGGQNV